MKKINISLVALLSCMVIAYAVPYSARIFATTEIALLPGGVQRMASTSLDPESGERSLTSIFGTNQLRQAATLADCDTLSIWIPETKSYQIWAQFTDGVFYKANDSAEWSLKIEGDPILPEGRSIWIKSPDTSTTTNLLFITGEVESTLEKTVQIHKGHQMLAYPFTDEIELNDLEFTTDTGTDSRFLFMNDHVTTSDGTTHNKYGLYTDNKWYEANSSAEWSSKIVSTEVVRHGTGFWYEAKKSFTWTEPNRFQSAFE